MSDPLTVNVGLAVPLRGSNVGVWDSPVNNDFAAIDGLAAGVVQIALSSTPVTLTSPAGFTPTPGAGPVESQNAVIQFSGALSANVTVTLPTPGVYILENNTTGAFIASFRALGSGEVIATPQGSRVRVYCDGTNVRFVEGLEGRPGKLEFEGGEIAVPAWITACTVKPYLLCDGTVYNIADFPALGAKYGSKFGGNGLTTFGVQDLRGRVPLAYDGTGTRITVAGGAGFNGQTMGAAGGVQGITLVRTDLPNTSVAVQITDNGHDHLIPDLGLGAGSSTPGSNTYTNGFNTKRTAANTTGITAAFNLNGNVTQTIPSNLQPSQVAGIWLVKT